MRNAPAGLPSTRIHSVAVPQAKNEAYAYPAQLTRLIAQYRPTGRLQRRQRTVTGALIRLDCRSKKHSLQRWAPLLNDFHRQHLNPYLNYHRPCFFPEIRTDSKGKERKVYPYENLMTPYEKLKSLPQAEQYLKPGVSFATLEEIAGRISDNQAADQLQKARQKLF